MPLYPFVWDYSTEATHPPQSLFLHLRNRSILTHACCSGAAVRYPVPVSNALRKLNHGGVVVCVPWITGSKFFESCTSLPKTDHQQMNSNRTPQTINPDIKPVFADIGPQLFQILDKVLIFLEDGLPIIASLGYMMRISFGYGPRYSAA